MQAAYAYKAATLGANRGGMQMCANVCMQTKRQEDTDDGEIWFWVLRREDQAAGDRPQQWHPQASKLAMYSQIHEQNIWNGIEGMSLGNPLRCDWLLMSSVASSGHTHGNQFCSMDDGWILEASAQKGGTPLVQVAYPSLHFLKSRKKWHTHSRAS